MYLESIEDCNYLQVTTRPGVSTPNFNIQISQIPCTASYLGGFWIILKAENVSTGLFLAPQGCLQYFTGTSGTVESYNIDGGVHLANQYYTICIRTEENYCTIKYDDTTYSLSAGNSVEGDDCTEDYIIIPDNAKNNNRYCGNSFASVDSKIFSIKAQFQDWFSLHFSLSKAFRSCCQLWRGGFSYKSTPRIQTYLYSNHWRLRLNWDSTTIISGLNFCANLWLLYHILQK